MDGIRWMREKFISEQVADQSYSLAYQSSSSNDLVTRARARLLEWFGLTSTRKEAGESGKMKMKIIKHSLVEWFEFSIHAIKLAILDTRKVIQFGHFWTCSFLGCVYYIGKRDCWWAVHEPDRVGVKEKVTMDDVLSTIVTIKVNALYAP